MEPHKRNAFMKEAELLFSLNHADKDQQFQLYPTFVYSVQAGIMSGQVYYAANSSDNNATIAVDTELGWYYIGGTPDREFMQQQFERLWQQKLKGKDRFTLFSSSEAWDQLIIETAQQPLRSITRQAFYYDYAANSTLPCLPSNYHLQKINQVILQKSSLFDERYIIEYWNSIDNYEHFGFGYAITRENESVCECISIAANPICAEMDIETDSAHRGQGLAMIAANAFIEDCLRQHRIPRWDCQADNKASYNLAIKLGFRPSRPYRLWVREVIPIL